MRFCGGDSWESMKKLTREEERNLTEEEYKKYYYLLRESFENSGFNNLSLKTRKCLYPLLILIIKI